MKILSFGEILFDINGDSACIGGAPFNFAAHAVRAGAEVSLLSSVGNDNLGKMALQCIKDYGVSADYVTVSNDFQTGHCNVTLSQDGIPCYDLVEDVAYDHIPVPNLKNNDFDVLYFGTLALRGGENIQTIKNIIEQNNFEEIFVDINIRPPHFSKETVCFALENATIIKISSEEIPPVGNLFFENWDSTFKTLNFIRDQYKNIRLLILTCGENGAVAYDNITGRVYRCDAVKTEVVSTVGAGDSFSATFLVNYLSGENIKNSLKKAAEVSAFVVAHEGAIP